MTRALTEEQRERGRLRAKEWYQKNRERAKKRMKDYRAQNQEKVTSGIVRWRKEHPEKVASYSRGRYERRRDAVQEKIAVAHGTNVRCMYDIHPNIPGELKQHGCWGELSFEHPNGGGKRDTKENGSYAVTIGILSGRRNPNDYLLLCRLHQIWNMKPGRRKALPSSESSNTPEDMKKVEEES